MNKTLNRCRLPFAVFSLITVILSIVQSQINNPMLLAERFITGGGWFEIIIIALYGSWVAYKMQEPEHIPRWRRITWSVFSAVFFIQLILGLAINDKFLMTGRLHIPIPLMILSGPMYRGQLSFMTLLFLSTIILTGPAWCCHLCYFGALDNTAASRKTPQSNLKNKILIKSGLLVLVISFTIILRWLDMPVRTATFAAIAFGITGILIMIFYSNRKGKMIHCILYCPIGTIVNFIRFANPFRLHIDKTCISCMKCTAYCKYDALGIKEIKNRKPSISCTLCGDCLAACHCRSIKYRVFNMNPDTARKLYLFLTISLHSCFMGLARI